METRFIYAVALIACLSVAACSRQEENRMELGDTDDMGHPVLVAYREDFPDSRTVIAGGGTSVFWSPNEFVQLFDHKESMVFQSRNTVPASRTTFYFSSMSEVETGDRNMQTLAFYPYSPDNEYHFTTYTEPTPDLRYKPFSIIHKIPTVQKGKAGTFEKDLYPAIALPDYDSGQARWTAVFSNVCGGARFSVTQEGITSVIIKSLGGEPITGTIDAGFTYIVNALDTLDVSVVQGVDSVKVIAPGSGFIPGTEYFAVMAPQVLKQGLEIRFIKNHQVASFTVNKPITIRRSHFGKLEQLDKGLVFTDLPDDKPQDIISFADERIKIDLVSAFDGNGDGELSYDEAATVSSLNDVFHGKEYLSFDEFQYFTNVSNLSENLFNGWTGLKSIVLPGSVRTISANCFKGCSSLPYVVIPGSITHIFPGAFSDCTALNEFLIENGGDPLVLSSEAISRCPVLASVTLPDRVVLSDKSFSECSSLKHVSIGESLNTTGFASAFYGCPIETVVIRDGLKRIEQYIFSGCASLIRVQLPESLESIGYGAFSNASIQAPLLLPNGLKSIDVRAFQNFNGSVSGLPEGLVSISTEAFYGCSGLTEITIPGGINVASGAFKQCPSLKEATILPNPGMLFDQLFADCYALTTVNLPEGLASIPEQFFSNCTALASITIPSTVMTIGKNAFSFSGLSEINLPSSLLTIGVYAFRKCENLATITFPESLLELREYAFYESGLTTVTLPDRLISIGASAFRNCNKLESVVISEKVQTLGASVFYNCPNLKSITILRAVPPSIPPYSGYPSDKETLVFGDSVCPIYVPDASVETYKLAENWSVYADRIKPMSEIPAGD